MNIDTFRTVMTERLDTVERVKAAAQAIEVSVATLYRYKKSPDDIPTGKTLALMNFLGIPLADRVSWKRPEFVAAERRRLELEMAIANGGTRYVVTPTFTVNAELPELSRVVSVFDYGRRHAHRIPELLELRAERRDLYVRGSYASFELIHAPSYLDFLNGTGRYADIPEEVRRMQVKELVRSMDMPTVDRRVYVRHTPELPVVSVYSTGVSILRADDFVVEFHDAQVLQELTAIFMDFFEAADLRSKDSVLRFLSTGDM